MLACVLFNGCCYSFTMRRGFAFGEVRVPIQDDFEHFKEFATDQSGWEQHYPKKWKTGLTKAYTRILDGSNVRAVKVESHFDDVSAPNVYDSLHDPDFRKTWDDAMREGSRICYVAPNSEIGYYRLKSPFGLKERDFVNQRAWYADGQVYIIMNHSVAHKHKLPVESVQRGVSLLTGYLIKTTGPNSCDFTFISHSDPRGKIPAWIVNSAVKTFAPTITKRLHDAACGYAAWKAVNKPNYKPWSNFEQLKDFPPLNPADVCDLARSLEASPSSDEEEVPDINLLEPSQPLAEHGHSLTPFAKFTATFNGERVLSRR